MEIKIDIVDKNEKEKDTIQNKLNELKKNLKNLEKIIEFTNILNDIRTSFSKDGIQRFV